MCHVPSWIKTRGGEILFLTDKDAKKHDIDLNDATGHTAIRDVFPDADEVAEDEGLHSRTPEAVRVAFEAGKFNKLASCGDVIVSGGVWNLPVVEVNNLVLEKGAKVTATRLRVVNEELVVGRRCTLDVPVLKEVAVSFSSEGKLIAPKLKSR